MQCMWWAECDILLHYPHVHVKFTVRTAWDGQDGSIGFGSFPQFCSFTCVIHIEGANTIVMNYLLIIAITIVCQFNVREGMAEIAGGVESDPKVISHIGLSG